MEANLNWRIKQFGMVVASGFGPEERAMAEAEHYIYLYELDDAQTMHLEVRKDGEKRWRKISTQS